MSERAFVLYLVTEPRVDLVAITQAALRAAPPGTVGVQLRAKDASASELLELARALLPICRAAGAPLFVNERADVARIAGADGVQLKERGLSVAEARAIVGPALSIARSCHDRAGLERAHADGADFATLAPIARVEGKNAPLGVDGFASAIAGVALPVYALGGVDAALAPALMKAGAAGVAVIRAVYAAPDPAAAASVLLARCSRADPV